MLLLTVCWLVIYVLARLVFMRTVISNAWHAILHVKPVRKVLNAWHAWPVQVVNLIVVNCVLVLLINFLIPQVINVRDVNISVRLVIYLRLPIAKHARLVLLGPTLTRLVLVIDITLMMVPVQFAWDVIIAVLLVQELLILNVWLVRMLHFGPWMEVHVSVITNTTTTVLLRFVSPACILVWHA